MPNIKLSYNLDKDTFKWETDLKEEKISEVVEEFLRTQVGLGKDPRVANELPVYEINISLDLLDDTFRVKSNTGNDSLMTGIVAHFLNKLKKDKEFPNE
jgi:hypothetical protein